MSISYKSLLDQMRAEATTPVEAPVLAKKNSLVPSRPMSSTPVPENESYDPVALATEWMRVIKTGSQKARERVAVKEKEDPAVAPVIINQVKEDEMEDPEMAKERSMFGEGDVSVSSKGGGKTLKDLSKINTLQDAVDATEAGGNYSTLFGHSNNSKFANVDVSKMTIGELKKFASPSGEYGQWVKDKIGRVSTPMGRYQIVGTTLTSTAKAMGLPDDTVFDSSTQDAMFSFLARQATSGGSTNEKVTKLRKEWEGLKQVPTAKLVSLIRQQEQVG